MDPWSIRDVQFASMFQRQIQCESARSAAVMACWLVLPFSGLRSIAVAFIQWRSLSLILDGGVIATAALRDAARFGGLSSSLQDCRHRCQCQVLPASYSTVVRSTVCGVGSSGGTERRFSKNGLVWEQQEFAWWVSGIGCGSPGECRTRMLRDGAHCGDGTERTMLR